MSTHDLPTPPAPAARHEQRTTTERHELELRVGTRMRCLEIAAGSLFRLLPGLAREEDEGAKADRVGHAIAAARELEAYVWGEPQPAAAPLPRRVPATEGLEPWERQILHGQVASRAPSREAKAGGWFGDGPPPPPAAAAGDEDEPDGPAPVTVVAECICGVMTGGIVDRRPGCTVHPLAAEGDSPVGAELSEPADA